LPTHWTPLRPPSWPGDAFADLDHLAGSDVFLRLYERHERDPASGLHPVLVLEGMPGAGNATAATALAAEDYSVIGYYDDAAFATPICHKGGTRVVFAV
jgi:hypothetical protein